MKIIISICIFFLLTGCQTTEFDKDVMIIKNEMNWLNDASPDQDFDKALENKDFRFVDVYGYSLTTPGVNFKCLNSEKDIKPIIGISDVVLGYEHAKLIAIAVTYARFYNIRMKIYLEENGKFKCNT